MMELENPLEKLPPHSAEAEQSILAAMLCDKEALIMVMDRLSPSHFYLICNQLLFSAIVDLFRLSIPVDIISTSEQLKEKGWLDEVGGRSYLHELAMSHLTTSTLEYSVNLVIEKAIAREVIIAGYQLITLAHQQKGNDALVSAQKAVFDIALRHQSKGEKTMDNILQGSIDTIEGKLLGKVDTSALQTGYPNLDAILGGMKPSNLVILAARPSMGKTAFALNVSSNIAYRQGKKALFFSMEMSGEELAQRLIYAEANSNHDLQKLKMVSEQIRQGSLLIIERPRLGIPQLRASIMRKKLELGGLDFVAIDYLQLMEGDGENQNIRISTLSRELKAIAREFQIPVLCLSQLSRGVESRQDKRPMLSDLRDSGAIEQDADIVMLMYRDEYYNKDALSGNTEVIVGKNRNGATGMAELYFRPNLSKFISFPKFRETGTMFQTNDPDLRTNK